MAAPRKTAAKKAPQRRRITFWLEDGHAHKVAVAGSFSNWDEEPIPLQRTDNGSWKATVLLPPGRYEYRFLVDGQWRDDPRCDERVANSFGSANCVLNVPGE